VGHGSFPLEILPAVERRTGSLAPDVVHQLYAPGVRYALRDTPEAADVGKHLFDRQGFKDGLGIISMEPDRTSVVLSATMPAFGHYLPPRTLKLLERYSAHLTSAVRLRNAMLEEAGKSAERVEAILDPKGRALDAIGPAREKSACETLADAVHRMEKARGRLRHTDPEEALELWQGLVDGTWSLVDRHDSDGKRFLLARRNQPTVDDPLALTPRERFALAYAAMGHQNKYVAYLLGLPAAKISRYLASARRKLRLHSRAELVGEFAPFVRPRSK
jgi:DNA-binding CsgD family transcriptional regulator